MSVLPRPAFTPTGLTWIGATTAVLRALGLDVDATDVAGASGYAFQLTVNDGVCPSGPTCVCWSSLAQGTMALGRSALVFQSRDGLTKEDRSERARGHAREAFELARREIEAGRPCVVWGIGIPEFSVVHGVEGDDYLVVPWGPVPERCRFDDLDAPGGPAVFAWPTERPADANGGRQAVKRAVRILSRDDLDPNGPGGPGAYDRWIEELTAGRATTLGNAYNAQCWAEARAFARDYTARLAHRHHLLSLEMARDALSGAADGLFRVTEIFPFVPSLEPVTDAKAIERAAGALRVARAADEAVLSAFRQALADWPAESPTD